jgi:hypothetical protein
MTPVEAFEEIVSLKRLVSPRQDGAQVEGKRKQGTRESGAGEIGMRSEGKKENDGIG